MSAYGHSGHLVSVFLGASGDAVERVSGVSSSTEDSIFVEEVSIGWRDLWPSLFANDEEAPTCRLRQHPS